MTVTFTIIAVLSAFFGILLALMVTYLLATYTKDGSTPEDDYPEI